MAKPTLQQVFGPNASQSEIELIISKQDLFAVGLLPSKNNTAESLFVAILLLAQNWLNESRKISNPEIQITIADLNPQVIRRNASLFQQLTYNINLRSPITNTIDPDNY